MESTTKKYTFVRRKKKIMSKKSPTHSYPRTDLERERDGQNLYRFHLRFMGHDAVMEIRRPSYKRANEAFKRSVASAEKRAKAVSESRKEWMAEWNKRIKIWNRARIARETRDINTMTFFDIQSEL